MTADETEPAEQRANGRLADSAARAYQRRSRREGAVAAGRLTRTGSPITAAMSRLPFVATIIGLLAIGIVGVLWLNTMSDATGLKATESRIRQAGLKTDIEALQKDVNTLNDPARIAAQAGRAGMVQPGDAAMLEVGADGTGTVLGTPTPVAAPATAVPTTPTTAPMATTPATTPVTTTSTPSSSAAATAPSATVGTTASPTASLTTTANKASAGRTTTIPTTTTPAKTAPAKTTPVKNTAAPAQQATTTGAGR